MTQRPEPKTSPLESIAGSGVGLVLDHVSSNVLSGLIENLADRRITGTPTCRFSPAICSSRRTRYSISAKRCNCCALPNCARVT